jgi:hypothetical protein
VSLLPKAKFNYAPTLETDHYSVSSILLIKQGTVDRTQTSVARSVIKAEEERRLLFWRDHIEAEAKSYQSGGLAQLWRVVHICNGEV